MMKQIIPNKWQKRHYGKWYRPVEPKELHANGEATQDELDAAQADAWWAARDAVLEAAREKQEAELRRICEEG